MSLNSFLLTFAFKNPTKPISFEPTFFNLSQLKPLDKYSTLFHLGLKHVPIPKPLNPTIIQESWNTTKDKLLWKEYFAARNDSTSDYNPKLKTPKPNTPFPAYLYNQRGILPSLSAIQTVIDTFTKQPIHPTITRDLTTINYIRKSYPHVIFTASDKNLGMCALHITDYHSLAMDHLQDASIYEQIDIDLDSILNQIKVTSIVHHFKKLTKQEKEFLLYPRTFSLPKFHLLPKVHKKTPRLQTRPIIGATNWCTTPVSILFDEKLKKHLSSFPAILRNSQDLIKCLDNIELQSTDWLVTIDVVSLYPSIDLNLLSYVLYSIDPTFPTISDFITRNNYFTYNNQTFRQTNGIAMGTNCAVNLAQIYLGRLLDIELLEHANIRLYKRYIDDIFMIFNGTEEELIKLFTRVNHMIPGISITYSFSKKETEFLDLKIFKDLNGTICYTTHQKSQNKYHYLSPKSCHPSHTLSGYIKGELIRYSRNSSHEFYFNHTRQLFFQRLLNRGYSRKYLTRIFEKVSYTRSETPQTPTLSITAFVIPYSVQLNFNALIKTLNNLFNQVNSNLKMKEKTKNFKLLLVYKKNQSVGQLLCRSALTKLQSNLINNTASSEGFSRRIVVDPTPLAPL
jgi:hypothetical protein